MRPYRGKTKEGKWVKGWYLEVRGTSNIYNKKRGLWIEVIPETVGQSTGLCDKNGKEYFADDIALSKDGLRKYIVTWHKAQGYWYLCGVGKAWSDNTPMWEEYEIIGTVHEKEAE